MGLMKKLKVHIKSFGCQMNKLDTAMATAAFGQAGFELAEGYEDSDIVLINTCSVREHAETKVFSHLGRLKHLKKSKPELIVGIIGCMAQRLGNELLNYDVVDIVCGPTQLPKIVDMVREAIETKQKKISVKEQIREKSSDAETQALENFESVYDEGDKQIQGQAFVRAMRGCNNFCTYCIVPHVRGPEISRDPQSIIDQIKRLAGEGTKLVTLLGQTVNSYEYKAGDKTYCLADLLEMASEVDGIEWIRFVTSYPAHKYFEQIMHAMADIENVCNYLHMPAQSGSDRILKAMNRHYTSAEYLGLIDKARSIVPDISIAGDFIVGFPSETEEDFQQTVELVKKAEYRNAFVFKYSPRPGTTSEKKLADDIDAETKKRRNIELLAVQEKISEKLSEGFLDKEVKILVEGLSKKPHLNKAENQNNPQLIGRTSEDYIVVFNGPAELAGNFTTVKITKTSPLTLFGEII